jgi:hypothetical protein
MFIVSLVEFSKRVQNEISAKVMPKPQNLRRILRIERIGEIMIRQKRHITPKGRQVRDQKSQ